MLRRLLRLIACLSDKQEFPERELVLTAGPIAIDDREARVLAVERARRQATAVIRVSAVEDAVLAFADAPTKTNRRLVTTRPHWSSLVKPASRRKGAATVDNLQ